MTSINLKNNQSGFTLVEMVLATAILSSAILAMIGAFILASHMVMLNRNREFASALGQSLIEQVRGATYAGLSGYGTFSGTAVSGGQPNLQAQAEGSVTDGPLSGLKQITVRYWFSYKGRTYQNYLVSYAADGGLND
jgi:prepilin-type N-terminal cleavage/methylation domain-containing protein